MVTLVIKLRPVLLIALLAACLFAVEGSTARAGERPDGDVTAQGSAEQQLAEMYAPIVHVRNQREACDTRGSPYVPMQVEFVLGVEDVVLRRHSTGRTTEIARAVEASDLYGLDDTYFLDFPGNPKRPGCQYERDFLARAGSFTPTVYAHIAREEGREGFALQFWFFYYFNHWNNTHEGDWEMIQINFEGMTPEEALTREPTGLGYSQHGGGERGDWGDDKVSREGTHPLVFAAAGANASQFESNIILGRGDNGTGFGCDDASPPTRRVETAVVLVEEPASANDEFAWLAYGGRWGERAPWEFNGPTGPNDKLSWTQPFTWQERLRPGSIIVPSRDTIGPNAVDLFCDVVWYASVPFALVLQLPPAVAFLLVGGIAVAAVSVASRTRYRPIIDTPVRAPRRFGQVLTSGWRIYRRNAVLFVAAAILFLPAGILIALLERVLFVERSIDTIAGFFPTPMLVEAVVAISLGNLTFGAVYWMVTTASIAGVARIDSGRRQSGWEDYKDVLRQLPGILWPRLKALVMVTALAISIVGIPWAIRQGFRWVFIEETILLDGTPSREAMKASAGAVDGAWWHTTFCLLVLAALGYLAGPAVGFLLLFWSPFGVSFINGVSSVIFAAVTPFVGICQALLYFDRTARRGP